MIILDSLLLKNLFDKKIWPSKINVCFSQLKQCVSYNIYIYIYIYISHSKKTHTRVNCQYEFTSAKNIIILFVLSDYLIYVTQWRHSLCYVCVCVCVCVYAGQWISLSALSRNSHKGPNGEISRETGSGLGKKGSKENQLIKENGVRQSTTESKGGRSAWDSSLEKGRQAEGGSEGRQSKMH